MVGVPRSSGCRLCVKRRVKCDERVPGCSKCETYGQPCPGYEKGFKFIAGKPHRTRRRAPETVEGQGCDTSHASPSVNSTPDASQPGSEIQWVAREEIPSTVISVDLNVLQGISALVNDFASPGAPESPDILRANWFGLLPLIYGQNRALDATLKSFTAHHFGRVLQNEQMVIYSRSAYGEALHCLRKALMNTSESLSSNILCTVVLLCIYELFTDTETPDSWMKHAKGLGQLIKVRGPDRYRSQLEISLLKSARGLIVMHAMFAGEDCFLASQEWHDMMREQRITTMSHEYHDSIEQFFAYFTHSPRIVHNLFRLREKDHTMPETLKEISEALTQVLDMQSKMTVWYEYWSQISSPPIEIPSFTGDTLFPMILTYKDVLDASVYCGYYAYMVIIHEALRSFGHPGPQEAAVTFFRDQICKSIEYASIGTLGPFRIGFAMRVAIETADPLTRSWLVGHLQEFSKTYAAAKPENYEPIP
ncbi:hypothetical protein N7456_009018 [Penicillium angulare]|uniref:Zn(2)-C6 fungal-type domain-containing protein n=1 Tax=Penicillium angulare TaxID=116970 RepID=A0A9W9F439_9EURO|nr:hypothetical protein N7456_009018 [Penicillium angulare]